jgi:hypothetical protein
MENGKSKFDRDNTLIWVIGGLLVCIAIEVVGIMHLKDDIKGKELVIKKLETIKRDTTEIDSLKTQIKDLKEWIADEDERCTVRMDQFYTQIIQQQYDKNNSK